MTDVDDVRVVDVVAFWNRDMHTLDSLTYARQRVAAVRVVERAGHPSNRQVLDEVADWLSERGFIGPHPDSKDPRFKV